MPSRCCVPLCKGNYPSGPKVSVFQFPKTNEKLQVWISKIQRKDFVPNKNTRICELHFTAADFDEEVSAYDEKTGRIVTAPLKNRRLKRNAVPLVFPDYPVSNSSIIHNERKCPEEKRIAKEMANLEKSIAESIISAENFEETRKVNSINDLKSCFVKFGLSDFWTLHSKENCDSIYLLHIELNPEVYIQYCVKIDNMFLTVAIEKNPVTELLKYVFPLKITHLNDVMDVLDSLENNFKSSDSQNSVKCILDIISYFLDSLKTDDNENFIKFIKEQLNLLLLSSNHFRYSSDILIFSCILKTISSHAYNFIRKSGNFILPHPDTLRKICNNLKVSPLLELEDENFLMYIKNRVNYICENDKTILLLIDEIHIKPFYDYKGGNIVGIAFNSNEAATSAFSFMISSLLSKFKEVVHILPVKNFNFQIFFNIIKKVVIGLEGMGLKVICVVTDNNSINGKAMSLFM